MSKFNSEAWEIREEAKIPFPISMSEIKSLIKTDFENFKLIVKGAQWNLLLGMVYQLRSNREPSYEEKLTQ